MLCKKKEGKKHRNGKICELTVPNSEHKRNVSMGGVVDHALVPGSIASAFHELMYILSYLTKT